LPSSDAAGAVSAQADMGHICMATRDELVVGFTASTRCAFFAPGERARAPALNGTYGFLELAIADGCWGIILGVSSGPQRSVCVIDISCQRWAGVSHVTPGRKLSSRIEPVRLDGIPDRPVDLRRQRRLLAGRPGFMDRAAMAQWCGHFRKS
jgi:hypothetical protein